MTRADVLARARSYVGTRETDGPNDAVLIRAWLRAAGVLAPAAWCAAFASACLGGPALAGAVRLGLRYPATTDPRPGDLMWFRTDASGHGHVGLVCDVRGREALCIEGNSADAVRYVRRPRNPDRVRFSRTSAEPAPAVHPDDAAAWATAPFVVPGYQGTR